MLKLDAITDSKDLKQVAKLLQNENVRLHKKNEELLLQVAKLQGKNGEEQLALELKKLQSQVNAMQNKMFAASSEKRPHDKNSKNKKKKKQTGHGPTSQPELPIEDAFFTLPKEEQNCELCGEALEQWEDKFEESEDITVVERAFKVRKLKRHKYRCKCGGCIKTAPGPLKVIEGGRYSLEFAVEVAIQKYLDHLPLERQVRIMKRQGLNTSSQTLWDQIWGLSRHLKATYNSLPAYIQTSPFIHFDETRWFLLAKGGRKTWQIWSQSSPFAVHYTLQPGRSKNDGAVAVGDYSGVIVCDGYAVYKSLAKDNPKNMTLAFCWAHVRRKFIEAAKTFNSCEEVVDLIGELYDVERQVPDPWRQEGQQRSELLKTRSNLRNEQARPIMKKILDWAKSQSGLDDDPHIKAIKYMVNHWQGLQHYLDDPNIPIDNNHAERTVRGPVIGRKNHYGSKSTRGTEVAAIFYSLIETAKLYNINPKTYILQIAQAAIASPDAILLPNDIK